MATMMVLVGGLPSSTILTVALIQAALLLTIVSIVRRIWFHPLAGYSGPLLGRFTDFLTVYSIFQKSRTFDQSEYLKTYGSPVRIGTNHLVYSDMQSWVDIYGQSSNPCLKHGEVYDGFSVTGSENILKVTDRHQHLRLRRLVSHSFSTKALLESQPFMHRKVEEYLDNTMKIEYGQTVGILEKTYELYLDIVSQLCFGQSFDCLSGKNPTARRDMMAFFEVVPILAFIPWVRYVPIPSLKEGVRGLDRLIEFSRANVDAHLVGETKKSKASPEAKFLYNLATAEDEETGTKLSTQEIVENAIIFLTAGAGTTAATTIFLIWECGRNEKVRSRLAEEIRAEFPDPNVAPSYEDASRLPFLKCVIEETLRLWGPLNISNPRVSPGKFISGRYVPKGVVVETCAYAAARDPRVFPNPSVFNPSRWETASGAMRNMSRPFSYGPRNCVGRHLAEIQLTLTVSRLYQLYDVVPHQSMIPEKMIQVDKGVLEPAFHHFLVIPTRRPSRKRY